jgi:hypothetical protein
MKLEKSEADVILENMKDVAGQYLDLKTIVRDNGTNDIVFHYEKIRGNVSMTTLKLLFDCADKHDMKGMMVKNKFIFYRR